MNIKKYVLDDMDRCYCNAHMKIDGEDFFIFASEANPGVCIAYHGNDFSKKEVIWDNVGGTMSIIPFEDRQGEFLAITEMYLKESPSRATVLWAKRTNGNWTIKPVMYLPYLHRIDIYNVNGKNYFVGATIARFKLNKEDWNQPGQIYVGEIPNDLNNENIKLKLLVDNRYINHGYCRDYENNIPCGYFGSEEGLIKVLPPHDNNDWSYEEVLKGRIGEISLLDINDDGRKELITIEPFHGNKIAIYQNINNEYSQVYQYSNSIDFAHALCSGTINNIKTFIIGIRKADEELAMIQYQNDKYIETIIDKEVGPANCSLVNIDNKTYILSSNHTSKKACIYEID